MRFYNAVTDIEGNLENFGEIDLSQCYQGRDLAIAELAFKKLHEQCESWPTEHDTSQAWNEARQELEELGDNGY